MHITKLGYCKLVQTHFEDTSELEFEPSLKKWKKIKKNQKYVQLMDFAKKEIKRSVTWYISVLVQYNIAGI